MHSTDSPLITVNGWASGYAFILSFLAPLWTICKLTFSHVLCVADIFDCKGSFDSAVHISEEASNAATAVPWAIVGAIAVAGVFGMGVSMKSAHVVHCGIDTFEGINVSLAFCMGTDIEGLMSNPIGQPMAAIFFNSFGKKGTLAIWAFVVIVQYV